LTGGAKMNDLEKLKTDELLSYLEEWMAFEGSTDMFRVFNAVVRKLYEVLVLLVMGGK